jgi:voltage-gated sodium channel type XI alpha
VDLFDEHIDPFQRQRALSAVSILTITMQGKFFPLVQEKE